MVFSCSNSSISLSTRSRSRLSIVLGLYAFCGRDGELAAAALQSLFVAPVAKFYSKPMRFHKLPSLLSSHEAMV